MSSPPIVSTVAGSTVNVTVNQWLRLSDLMVITPTDGDPILGFTVADFNNAAGSARLWYDGAFLTQGGARRFDGSVSLSDIWIQAGSSPGTDDFRIQSQDKDGFDPGNQISLVSQRANAAPVVIGAGTTVNAGASVAATSLVSVTDADGDAVVTYRFWDPAGGGVFKLNGVTQASGQNLDIAAADIGNLRYFGGANAGRETLWVQVYDGIAWSAWASWSEQTVRNTNTLPVASAANRNIATGEWIRASDLTISVTDADGDTPTQYRFTDGTATAGSVRLWMGGNYVAQGGTATVNTADLANLWIQGGANNGTDAFTVEVNDGYGWSNAAAFNLVTRAPNRAPVVAGSGATVAINTAVAATSLINVTDADGDTPTLYRFWDPAGGGVFKLSGVTQASGQNLDIAAASIANLTYTGGATAGRETLWAQVYDGQAWSAWASWNQQTVRNTNTLSVASAANRNVATGEWIRASQLSISVTDADGDAPGQYRFTDGTSTAGSVQLWFGGSFVAQGGTATVSAADLANLWIQGGANNGTDAFTVEVNDGFGWSNAAAFNLVTRAPNRAPVVAGAGTTVTVGGSVAAASLINVTDADGDTPTLYRFWDPAGGGVFKLSGVTQASNQNLDVAAADIANLRYFGSAPAGRETIWAQVYDGQAWSAWTSWSQQTVRAGNTVSVVSAPNRNITSGDWVRASQLSITVTDADGDVPTQYRFTDGTATAGSVQLWMGGNYVAQGGSITVNAADLANLWIQGGANNGTDAFTVEVYDGFGWSNAAAFNVVTRAPNRAPTVSIQTAEATTGLSMPLTGVVSVSDADGDLPTIYRFWDASGGGHFELNGQVLPANQNLDIAGADFANLRYVGGADSGKETIWVQVYDGQAWSGWVSYVQQTYDAINPTPVYATRADDQIDASHGDDHAYIGLYGDDLLTVTDSSAPFLLGGHGNDTYDVEYVGTPVPTGAVILENGNSSNDTVRYVVDATTFVGIIDGRHLFLGSTGNGSNLIVLDWQRPENRIENWIAVSGGNFVLRNYAEFVAWVNAFNPLNVSWETLEQSSRNWNTAIDQLYALVAAHETNAPPTLTATQATLLPNQTYGIRALSAGTFGYADSDGDPVSSYEFRRDASNTAGFFGFAPSLGVGQSVVISAATLQQYGYYVTGTQSGVDTYSVRAFDGIDWGAWVSINTTISEAATIPQDLAGDTSQTARYISVGAQPVTVSDWLSPSIDPTDAYRFVLDDFATLSVSVASNYAMGTLWLAPGAIPPGHTGSNALGTANPNAWQTGATSVYHPVTLDPGEYVLYLFGQGVTDYTMTIGATPLYSAQSGPAIVAPVTVTSYAGEGLQLGHYVHATATDGRTTNLTYAWQDVNGAANGGHLFSPYYSEYVPGPDYASALDNAALGYRADAAGSETLRVRAFDGAHSSITRDISIVTLAVPDDHVDNSGTPLAVDLTQGPFAIQDWVGQIHDPVDAFVIQSDQARTLRLDFTGLQEQLRADVVRQTPPGILVATNVTSNVYTDGTESITAALPGAGTYYVGIRVGGSPDFAGYGATAYNLTMSFQA